MLRYLKTSRDITLLELYILFGMSPVSDMKTIAHCPFKTIHMLYIVPPGLTLRPEL